MFISKQVIRIPEKKSSKLYKIFSRVKLQAFIIPVSLEYCVGIHTNKIETIQRRAAHFVLKKPWRRNYLDNVSSMLAVLQLWPLLYISQQRKCARLT